MIHGCRSSKRFAGPSEEVLEERERAMVIEIRIEGTTVKVRRFGTVRGGNWVVVSPGGEDRALTQFSYQRLRELGEGIWELPVPVPSGAA
jgi:hypothetical protein